MNIQEPKKGGGKGENLIGLRLREFARERFGTVAEMERDTGKGLNFFQHYVEGKSKPGSELLTLLANKGLNVQWLLTGEGDWRSEKYLREHSLFPREQQHLHSDDWKKKRTEGMEVLRVRDFKMVEKDMLVLWTLDDTRVAVIKETNEEFDLKTELRKSKQDKGVRPY